MQEYFLMGKARKNSKTFKKQILKTDSLEELLTRVKALKKEGYGIIKPYFFTHFALINKEGINDMVIVSEYKGILVSPSEEEAKAIMFA